MAALEPFKKSDKSPEITLRDVSELCWSWIGLQFKLRSRRNDHHATQDEERSSHSDHVSSELAQSIVRLSERQAERKVSSMQDSLAFPHTEQVHDYRFFRLEQLRMREAEHLMLQR